ncbi:MAG: hypothetical protein U5L11_05890 [Arhodomonas sp.]|nr:hypothetical protein [Arhodomonas sp.]
MTAVTSGIPAGTLLSEAGTRRAGDRIDGLLGILDHAFGAWRIHPVGAVRFTTDNPRPPALQRQGPWRLAGFNVENYFLSRDGRGPPTVAGFRAQRRRLADAVAALDADILALQEIEDRPEAVRDLVAAVNAGLQEPRRYRAAAAGLSRDESVIRNALLYRPARLEPVEVALDDAPVHDRAPVAAVFRDREGRRARVVSVHFKSRGGCPGHG